jgi:uncharacterized UBP type Zn finger protein
MGFPEERARPALVHFRNNMDRAMDYLMNTPPEADAHILSNGMPQRSEEIFTANEDALNTLIEMGYNR